MYDSLKQTSSRRKDIKKIWKLLWQYMNFTVVLQMFGMHPKHSAAQRAEEAKAAVHPGGGSCEGVWEGRREVYPFKMRRCHVHRLDGLKSILWGQVPSTTAEWAMLAEWELTKAHQRGHKPKSEEPQPTCRLDSKIESLQLIYCPTCKERSQLKNGGMHRCMLQRQAIYLALIITLQNKLLRSIEEWIQETPNSTGGTLSFSVTWRKMNKIIAKVVWQYSKR